MNNEIWLAIAIVLIIEGLAPLISPKQWQQLLAVIIRLPSEQVRKYAGCLVVAGVTLLFILLR